MGVSRRLLTWSSYGFSVCEGGLSEALVWRLLELVSGIGGLKWEAE